MKGSNNPFPSALFAEQGSNPSTPASGNWRLYFKSDGIYAIDDAGNVFGPFAGSGSFNGTLLQRTEVAAAGQASIDLSSISATYDYIEITICGVSERSADVWDGVLIAFNTDTTAANYRRDRLSAGGGSHSGDTYASDRQVADIPGVNGKVGSATIRIYNYASGAYKNLTSLNSVIFGDTDSYIMTHSVVWKSTSAINRITLTTVSGSDFAENFLCMIVGYKS